MRDERGDGDEKKAVLILIGLLLPLAAGAHEENPHAAAERCREGFTSDCDANCSTCHLVFGIAAPVPPGPDEVYGSPVPTGRQLPPGPPQWGDLPLCLECHPDKGGGFHNHPVAVLYPAGHPEFLPVPIGAKLFCDEMGCWVFCSSCHDPHHARDRAVRRFRPAVAMCQGCHVK